MTLDEWMTVAGEALGVDLDDDLSGLRTVVLDLARDAAHGIARPAAPLTTFLVGVAVGGGMTLTAAADAVRAILPSADEPATK